MENIDKSKVFLWDNFVQIGKEVDDNVIYANVRRQRPGMCCCLIYTSGTTGKPKGCMLSHDNLVWSMTPTCQELQRFRPDIDVKSNRIISYLPLSHIAGLCMDIMLQMTYGSKVYFAKPDAL